MDKYQIQIFGLQRSGTNFLHWTLNNNFILDEKIDYSLSNDNVKGNIKGMARYNQPQSIKHLYPTFEYSNYIIGIYKNFDNWFNSAKKSKHLVDINMAKDIHKSWLDKFDSLPNQKKILLNYEEFVNKYETKIMEISNKFNLKINNPIIFPKYEMNKGGEMTNKKFNK